MPESALANSDFLTLFLVFAATLLGAVLISGTIRRSVLSMAVLFLIAGISISLFFPEVVPGDPSPILMAVVELALFGVLFTDGMRVGAQDLASAWRLPGRALLLGMPIMFVITAGMARLILNMPWVEALLLGAVLSPTDPVLAAAIIGREEVPYRLRRLLNVESGINDGLALPLVIAFLSILSGGAESTPQDILLEVSLGVLLGIAIPWAAIQLGRLRIFSPTSGYEPFFAFSIGLLLLVLSALLGANSFLAAFIGGMMITSLSPAVRDSFHRFGEILTELLKLFSLFIFGVLISLSALFDFPPGVYLFAFLVLFAVRPIAIGLSLLGSPISRPEWIAAGWFGPKGFASMVYGLLVLQTGYPGAREFFNVVVLVIVGSILLHSSTDVLVASWFQHEQKEEQQQNLAEEPDEEAEEKGREGG